MIKNPLIHLLLVTATVTVCSDKEKEEFEGFDKHDKCNDLALRCALKKSRTNRLQIVRTYWHLTSFSSKTAV